MEQQQKNTTLCSTCYQYIPNVHFALHQVRCGMKKQSKLRPQSRMSIQTRSHIRKKLFQEQKGLINKYQQQQKIACTFCGYMQSFSELDTHPSRCPGQGQNCQHCGQNYPSQLLQQHKQCCQYNSQRYLQEQQQQVLQYPIDRLQHLFSLINALSQAMRGLQGQQEQGLSRQKIQQLQHFKCKQNKQQQLCIICYCKYEKNQNCIKLDCKHVYHKQCIQEWFQKSSKCPVCKHDQNKQ